MAPSPFGFLMVALACSVLSAVIQGEDAWSLLWPSDSFFELPSLELEVADGGFFDAVATAIYNLALIIVFPFTFIVTFIVNIFVWIFSFIQLVWALLTIDNIGAPEVVRMLYFMFMSTLILWWLAHFTRAHRA